MKYETVKSSKEIEKAIINAPTTEGIMFGNIILKKTICGEHPRSKAASTMFGSICLILGIIVKTTYGIPIVMCEIKAVKKPNSAFKMFNINFASEKERIPGVTIFPLLRLL